MNGPIRQAPPDSICRDHEMRPDPDACGIAGASAKAVTVEAGSNPACNSPMARVPTSRCRRCLTPRPAIPKRLNTKNSFLPAVGAIWDITADDQLLTISRRMSASSGPRSRPACRPLHGRQQRALHRISGLTRNLPDLGAGLRSRHHALDLNPLTRSKGQISAYHVISTTACFRSARRRSSPRSSAACRSFRISTAH
ncbi:unnamed protein product [Acanthosepion pharaonis]|uniref:Uncharacterized protein n=1 Tax=Acanthosepion pharaonis TaxID=158019 RepID=A0A812DTM0_ACAPH|nr:unnamed protein product [Sepia pharaonis]